MAWRSRFSWWRRCFRYEQNSHFATACEIGFRGAFWLTLFAWPTIRSNTGEILGIRMQVIGPQAIVACVYTLAPTMGITIKNAWAGLSGTAASALVSWLMYAVYYDGCSGKCADWPRIDACHFWRLGDLTGECKDGSPIEFFFPRVDAWLVGFRRPCRGSVDRRRLAAQPARELPDLLLLELCLLVDGVPEPGGRGRARRTAETERPGLRPRLRALLGWKDWGGGVSLGVMKMFSGFVLALLIVSLPYPITCMMGASDRAAVIAHALARHWENTIEFYTAQEADEISKTKMLRSMRTVETEIFSLNELLEGSYWEVVAGVLTSCVSGPRLVMMRLANLSKLSRTLSRCLQLLGHVVDACEREKFEASHQSMMISCKGPVVDLATSTIELLESGLQKADDGVITEVEKEQLRLQVQVVEGFEDNLNKHVNAYIDYITRGKPYDDARELRGQLATEHVFMFCLCDFADSLQMYCTWLTDGQTTDPPLAERLRRCCGAAYGGCLLGVLDKSTIFAPKNRSFVARTSLFDQLCRLWSHHRCEGRDHTVDSRRAPVSFCRFSHWQNV
ncbi:unnamed protein product [Prorocentrum cordatum]|uniref:Uncharacterized protein n=1 Tax=Prorocentrum cordatum TaxID=2364126 RepID=A0ABN9RIC5_9DINO|nr:unnamed protein product [Polarella glacialis]